MDDVFWAQIIRIMNPYGYKVMLKTKISHRRKNRF